jgi:hypothetical protein
VSSTTAKKFVSKVSRSFCGEMVGAVLGAPIGSKLMPALLTRMSSRPYFRSK